jgi:hypothetical protein
MVIKKTNVVSGSNQGSLKSGEFDGNRHDQSQFPERLSIARVSLKRSDLGKGEEKKCKHFGGHFDKLCGDLSGVGNRVLQGHGRIAPHEKTR